MRIETEIGSKYRPQCLEHPRPASIATTDRSGFWDASTREVPAFGPMHAASALKTRGVARRRVIA